SLILLTQPILLPFPYTTLFRSNMLVFLFKNSEELENELLDYENVEESRDVGQPPRGVIDKLIELYIGNNTTHLIQFPHGKYSPRSEEHTSELQSRFDLVCRLLL